MTGLVSKARHEKQKATAGLYAHQREETKQGWFGITHKVICSCGFETAGIFKDDKMRCHKCGTAIITS